jgi:hypothetical protein
MHRLRAAAPDCKGNAPTENSGWRDHSHPRASQLLLLAVVQREVTLRTARPPLPSGTSWQIIHLRRATALQTFQTAVIAEERSYGAARRTATAHVLVHGRSCFEESRTWTWAAEALRGARQDLSPLLSRTSCQISHSHLLRAMALQNLQTAEIAKGTFRRAARRTETAHVLVHGRSCFEESRTETRPSSVLRDARQSRSPLRSRTSWQIVHLLRVMALLKAPRQQRVTQRERSNGEARGIKRHTSVLRHPRAPKDPAFEPPRTGIASRARSHPLHGRGRPQTQRRPAAPARSISLTNAPPSNKA